MATINTTEGTIIDAPFSFKNFRTAASYAFDYDAFMNAAVNGIGIQAKGPVPQGMLGHNGTMYTFTYDLDAAVTEWNLAMQNPNFVNTLNAMNNRLTLYYNSGNTVREQGSLLLADGLAEMYNKPSANHTGLNDDMTFTTQALEWSNYLDHIRQKKMPIFFVGWAPDYADADNYIFPFCYEYGTYAMRIGYNNTDVNAWYEAAKIETNPETRQHYFDLIQEQVAEDTPYLWVYQIVEFRAWRTWMQGNGLIYNPMHSYYFLHLYKDYTT
jgi:peptide/nickel transport system substrate-binding protein